MSVASHNSDGAPVDPASKRQRLRAIIEAPSRWQVCEGCDRLVAETRVKCPACHAYRFDSSRERVVAAAKAAMKRPAEEFPC